MVFEEKIKIEDSIVEFFFLQTKVRALGSLLG